MLQENTSNGDSVDRDHPAQLPWMLHCVGGYQVKKNELKANSTGRTDAHAGGTDAHAGDALHLRLTGPAPIWAYPTRTPPERNRNPSARTFKKGILGKG